MTESRKQAYLVLGCFLAAFLLMALLIPFVVKKTMPATTDLLHFEVPDDHFFNSPSEGRFTLYYEDSAAAVEAFEKDKTRPPAGLQVKVRNMESSRLIALETMEQPDKYRLGLLKGIGLYSMELISPGSYTLSAHYEKGRRESRIMLALGRDAVSNSRLQQIIIILLFVVNVGMVTTLFMWSSKKIRGNTE